MENKLGIENVTYEMMRERDAKVEADRADEDD